MIYSIKKMMALDVMVNADSQELEIILGCSLGVILCLAIIVAIAGFLIKARFKGTYSCLLDPKYV